jgi:hypothetical protein
VPDPGLSDSADFLEAGTATYREFASFVRRLNALREDHHEAQERHRESRRGRRIGSRFDLDVPFTLRRR